MGQYSSLQYPPPKGFKNPEPRFSAPHEVEILPNLGKRLTERYGKDIPAEQLALLFQKEFFPTTEFPELTVMETLPPGYLRNVDPGFQGLATEGRDIIVPSMYLKMKDRLGGILAHESQHIADVEEIRRQTRGGLPFSDAYGIYTRTNPQAHSFVGDAPAEYWLKLLEKNEKRIPLPSELKPTAR